MLIKTELLSAGSKYSQSSLGSKGLSLQIDSYTVTVFNHVCVLSVTFLDDLSLDKHVSSTRASCFFWLCQLRRVRRPLGDESLKTLWWLELTTATWYSPAYRGLWPTYYNRCWTPPLVSSAPCASTTEDHHGLYKPTCTGSLWQTGSNTSLV